jgi:hypothetical protein
MVGVKPVFGAEQKHQGQKRDPFVREVHVFALEDLRRKITRFLIQDPCRLSLK